LVTSMLSTGAASNEDNLFLMSSEMAATPYSSDLLAWINFRTSNTRLF
jgi:hypothetical protein